MAPLMLLSPHCTQWLNTSACVTMNNFQSYTDPNSHCYDEHKFYIKKRFLGTMELAQPHVVHITVDDCAVPRNPAYTNVM